MPGRPALAHPHLRTPIGRVAAGGPCARPRLPGAGPRPAAGKPVRRVLQQLPAGRAARTRGQLLVEPVLAVERQPPHLVPFQDLAFGVVRGTPAFTSRSMPLAPRASLIARAAGSCA